MYDGLILILLIVFKEYPTDSMAIILTFLNPIDLSRVMIMLGLDIAALMGYTGALFLKFFGSASGILITLFSMICWIVVPSYFMIRIAKKKDF